MSARMIWLLLALCNLPVFSLLGRLLLAESRSPARIALFLLASVALLAGEYLLLMHQLRLSLE